MWPEFKEVAQIRKAKRGAFNRGNEMNIRERNEQTEHVVLSEFAAFSDESAGRDRPEPQCDLRTVYSRDRDRIIHCKSFRRLKHKTQVFLAPAGDHYRTRLTHTLEVSQIARTIAKSLRLNEDLTEAIALGHDLGHTPFGHAGETALNDVCPLGFEHYKQSLRVVEFLENNGRGLNLTKEVRDGILNHRTSGRPATLEGQAVRFSDKIAYINHDIDDAIRGGIMKEEDIPQDLRETLGMTTKERLNNLIHDIVLNSEGMDHVKMSSETEDAIFELRKFMFDHVYTNSDAKSEETKAKSMIKQLYAYYSENPDEMPSEYVSYINELGQPKERVVCDYIAGMSDQYSVAKFKEIFVPASWQK